MKQPDFSWVDEYFQNVKPYIFVRLEDHLLIKRPNEVQKLNKTGALILKTLLDGTKINELLKKMQADEEKTLQTYQFLSAIKDSVDGHISIFDCNPAITKKTFDGSFSELPVLSELAITYRCNLKCSFCYAGCNLTQNPINSDKELSTAELKAIIQKIATQAKVPSISFTGGEPLLRADLPDLIACAKSLDMRVNLISNGTLVNPVIAKKLVENGLDSAQISIEGITDRIHDHLVGKTGAFEKSIEAVHTFKALGIHVHTNTTLNGANIHQAAEFPGFVKNTLGLKKFSMNMMIPSGSVTSNQLLKLNYKEMGAHLKAIIRQSKIFDVEFMWYSPLPLCMFNTITHGLGNKGCAACDGLLSVAPNGDVLPCASYDDSVGNIHDSGFEEVWHGSKAGFYRKKEFAHPICRNCEHFAICNGACPLYWRNMGYEELISMFETKETQGDDSYF